MKRLRLLGVVCACILQLVVCTPALAATIQYNYTGLDFSSNDPDPAKQRCTIGDPGCFNNITASFEISTALGSNQPLLAVTPDAWSISDGLTTITDQTPNFLLLSLVVRTDAVGDIDAWNFVVYQSAPALNELSSMRTTHQAGNGTADDTRYCTDTTTGSCYVAVAENMASPGNWTTTTVPIPATIWLFTSGLLGLIGVSRRS